MNVALCGSMVFTEQMLEVKQQLERLGHSVLLSSFVEAYVGKSVAEKETLTLYHKKERDAIRDFWEKIKVSDAILVLNYDRRGVRHYIGGNTLMEIGFAHVLGKKIFLLNPVPDIVFYRSEIEAVRPIVIEGDLGRVR